MLSKEQLAQFNDDGFLVLKGFVEEELCDKILEKAKEHMKVMNEPIETEEEYLDGVKKGTTLRRLRQVYDRESVFKDWMEDKSIRPILKQVLGETPVLTLAHHNSIMTKLAHVSSHTSWHQDRRYWNYADSNLVSVWLALGDEYLENGLLEFIPGSHKIDFKKEQFDEKTAFREDLIENQELIAKKVHTNLNKGDVVLFHCKTLHYANKNNTDKDKVSFVYTVKGISTKPIEGTRSEYKEVVLEDN